VSEPDARFGSSRALWPGGALGLSLFVVLYLGLAVSSARRTSVTVDELGHLPSGLYFLATGDARFASLNPPLVNAISALPVLALDLRRELDPPAPSDDVFSFWSTGYQFQEAHREDYLRIFEAARLAPIAGVAVLGALLFFWGRRLAPDAPNVAGLLAAGLVLFSPNVLAQARLVGTETGTAFFVAVAHVGLARMLNRPGVGTTVLCGVALGLAQLAKFYALLLYPVFLGLTLAWPALSGRSRAEIAPLLARFAGASALSLAVLNAGYAFQEVGASLDDLALQSETLRGIQGSALASLPLPLPGAYVRAFDGQLVELGSKLPSFLFGETFEGGRWYFYLGLLAIKTPLALFAALGVAIAVSFRRTRLPWRETALLLAYPLVLFVLLSASPGRQLGSRALLSAAPLVWLWAATAIARARGPGWPRIAAAAALAGLIATALWSHPHYLSFFNVFAGGSQEGYRYASAADVDIGQDLVLLSEYVREQTRGADTERVQLLYFGSVDPALYGIDYEIPANGLEPGLLAVSVSLYRHAYPTYDHGALRIVGPVEVVGLGPPVAMLGGSIHVYRVEERDPATPGG
jgi:hypothetical protein